jgi:tetrapyrrole methylase family protein/MazG family protein
MAELTIVGLGPGGAGEMSVAAYRAVTERGRALVRTSRHPAVEDLRSAGVQIESLDHLYETATDFDSQYRDIAVLVLRRARADGDLIYGVPGHPLFGERTVSLILEEASEAGVEVHILASQSFVDAALVSGRLSADGDLLVLDAHCIDKWKLDATLPTLVYQVDSLLAASDAKLALLERYPHDWPVTIVREGADPLTVPLHEMDRQVVDHLTSVWIPPVPTRKRPPTWDDLVRVVARLRAPDGCPWDLEQTHDSIKRCLLEESYEAIEAIEHDDPAKLEEELGDILMQPVLHAVMAEQEGVFTIDDVIAGITRKLVRRHPHVFGEVSVADSDEVLRNWESIKSSEKAHAHRSSALDGVPRTMPSLMRALDISRKAVKVGFEWPDAPAVLDKVEEEIRELRAEMARGDTSRAADEIGDLLFSLVNIARWLGIDPEEALRRMVDRFTERFQAMEAMAAADNRELRSLSLDEWDVYWERAKRECAG